MSSIPWQAEWKNPQWTHSEEAVEGGVHGICSALVTRDEIPTSLLPSGDDDEIDQEEDHLLQPQHVLTVSLLTASSQDLAASKVLLQLEEHSTPSSSDETDQNQRQPKLASKKTRIVAQRLLSWPESLSLPDDGDIRSNRDSESHAHSQRSNASSFWLGLFGNKDDEEQRSPVVQQGVVSACLCRKPSSNGINDALDTIAMMGLGIPDDVMEENQSNYPSSTSQEDDHAMSDGQEEALYLSCITSRGMVCVYSPWTLLAPNPSIDNTVPGGEDEDAWVGSVATLFFGADVYQTLQDGFKPLCEPLTTISLSVLDKRSNNPKAKSLWWNPLVERSTFAHRTVYNKPTQIQNMGLSHIIVAGKGLVLDSLLHEEERHREAKKRRQRRAQRKNVEESASKTKQRHDWWKSHDKMSINQDPLHPPAYDQNKPWWNSSQDLPSSKSNVEEGYDSDLDSNFCPLYHNRCSIFRNGMVWNWRLW